MTRRVIADLTTTDPQTAAPVAVLPVGSFEQHGPFLPLGTDTLIACAIGTSIAKHHNVFQLPPITFGCSHEHDDFPGTISISATTLHTVITDIAASLRVHGMRGLIIVNAHGGNAILTNTVQQANRPGSAIALGLYPSREDWDHARTAAALVSTMHDDMHAGELEASILLAAYPDYLRDGWTSSDHAATDRRYLTTVGMRAYTTSGVIGYPSHATADKGHRILDDLGQAAKSLIDLVTAQGL